MGLNETRYRIYVNGVPLIHPFSSEARAVATIDEMSRQAHDVYTVYQVVTTPGGRVVARRAGRMRV